jgi:hypothetical protein
LEQFYCHTEIGDRVGVRGALECLLAGAAEIFHGLVGVGTMAIVMRQLS